MKNANNDLSEKQNEIKLSAELVENICNFLTYLQSQPKQDCFHLPDIKTIKDADGFRYVRFALVKRNIEKIKSMKVYHAYVAKAILSKIRIEMNEEQNNPKAILKDSKEEG